MLTAFLPSFNEVAFTDQSQLLPPKTLPGTGPLLGDGAMEV